MERDVTFEKLGIDFSGFDAKRAFAAGLAGVGTYGALTLWATIVAAGSNLGGYILLAKVVSVLSSIGISLGGTSAVAAAVAAIGGPVTLIVGLSALAVLSVFGINQTIWKKRFAKDLNEAYKKENYQGKYIEQINVYWNETIEATDACLDSLEAESLEYYRKKEALAIKLMDDKEQKMADAIRRIYYTICSIYLDLQYRVTLDKDRMAENAYNEQLNDIMEEIDDINNKHRYKLVVDFKARMKGVIFMTPETRVAFWEDIVAVLDELFSNSILYFCARKPI